jgi:hypothetical protein
MNIKITGLSHFFEHMMFNGAKIWSKLFDRTMEFNGGANNAYTTENVTVYTNWFPASASKLYLILRRQDFQFEYRFYGGKRKRRCSKRTSLQVIPLGDFISISSSNRIPGTISLACRL